MNDYLFASGSVVEGHPDKMASQTSDAILDAILLQDPWGKAACECLVKTGATIVAGEISTHATMNIEEIVRNAIREIDYDHSRLGFDGNTCYVLNILGKQSVNTADGIRGHPMEELGAGDQDIALGYACDEMSELMPTMLVYTHRLMGHQAQLRKPWRLPFLLPDTKSQVTLRYQDNHVHSVDTVVASIQHSLDVSLDTLREAVIEEIVKPVMPSHWLTLQTRFLVNPAGSFVIGGPVGSCELTGRKITVDTYGDAVCHGNGASSDKDPSKVGRSVTYATYCVTKNIVAAGLAPRYEVQLGWVVGPPRPISTRINIFGTQTVSSEVLLEGVSNHFDLSVFGAIIMFDLPVPRYRRAACYGHFDRDSFPWEVTDKAALLYKDVGH